MPTLLVRGSDDTTSTHAGAVRLLAAVASPEKWYRVVAPGSHFLCIEKNRKALYQHLNDFFAPLGSGAAQA
jgi:alpha-beta hydrolase superfamily lysophospholipase